jgi:hypothetical protein
MADPTRSHGPRLFLTLALRNPQQPRLAVYNLHLPRFLARHFLASYQSPEILFCLLQVTSAYNLPIYQSRKNAITDTGRDVCR